MKIADLFAGVGGIRLGAKGTTVFANDIDKYCKTTYDLNFNPPLTLADIQHYDYTLIPDFDWLTGGFPCQPFSQAGHRKGFDDTRGTLFFNILQIIQEHNPDGVFLENVKGLLNHDKGKTLTTIIKHLTSLGYSVTHKVLNTSDFGLPQNRERLFIVAKKGSPYIFPYTYIAPPSFRELLEGDVPSKYYYTPDRSFYPLLAGEVNDKDSIYQYRRVYVRKNMSNVCPTLTANMGTGGNNVPIIKDDVGIRRLTPRECFRLQGFPDTYRLPDIADCHLYKQAGNSVSVPVISSIFNAM